MYKGIKIKNSDQPSFVSDRQASSYNATSTTTTIDHKKYQTVKINNLSQNIVDPQQYFSVGQTFLYHNTVIFNPLEPEQQIGIETSGLPYYEFYDKFNYNPIEYNEFAQDYSELDLPNFYLSKKIEENDRYEDLFAFSFDISSRKPFKNSYSLRNGYNERTEEQSQQLRNIFLGKDAQRYGVNERNNFPYAIDIKLNFKDIDIMSSLLDSYGIHKSSLSLIDSLPKSPVSFDITNVNFDEQENTVANIPVAAAEDLLDFAYFPRDGGLVYLPDTIQRSRYTENLVKVQARRDYNEMATSNLPDILSILYGDTVKNEILYVKLEKYIGEPTGQPLQNIWIRDASVINQEDPSKSKFGIYDYFDTQVKIGQTYTYVIKGYVMIYGAEVTCMSADRNEALFMMKPSYKIAEVELGRKTITVLPPIPLSPYVLPFYDTIKNKMSFYFHLEQGQEFKDYITFQTSDEVYRQKIYDTSQYKKPEHGYLEDRGVFEVFRLEKRPVALEEFSNNKIAEVSRDGFDISAVFSQNIAFDKDYYYLFRSLNFLRYPSNPSKVYRVNLKKGIEKNILDLEIFDIPPIKEQYDTEKRFTKLLHIMPNIRDTFLNAQATEELDSYAEQINNVKMGLNENFSVWGKKYKIRIKSNNTGKKIDLNVRFKLTREQ